MKNFIIKRGTKIVIVCEDGNPSTITTEIECEYNDGEDCADNFEQSFVLMLFQTKRLPNAWDSVHVFKMPKNSRNGRLLIVNVDDVKEK